jgi:hypothetical protein
MANIRFDPATQTLLEPVTNGPLRFRSIRTGATFDATDSDTLLASNSESHVDIVSKYRNTIVNTAYDPVNPRMEAPCPNCERTITSFQRLGESKRVIHVCVCGHKWM